MSTIIRIAVIISLLMGINSALGLNNQAGTSSNPDLQEASFYKKMADNKVQCNLCYRECRIPDGSSGFCRVRKNIGGSLYSLVYGRPVGLQVDPIEMEPMHHFLPGHDNLCVYTASCNFRCSHCQNWHISQRSFADVRHREYSAEEVVAEAIKRGCKSISHSINEPTVFYEYMYDIAKAAQEKGLKVIFHTNAYIKPEPLRALLEYMDGVTVDLKGFSQQFYSEVPQAELDKVLESLKIISEEEKHLEIVYLVIPGLNDCMEEIEEMSSWINANLGSEIPLHFNRFFPRYKLTHLHATPISTLEQAREKALNAGLKYVYIGNAPGHKGNHTYCPGCNKKLIERGHNVVLENKIDSSGRCRYCGEELSGVWE